MTDTNGAALLNGAFPKFKALLFVKGCDANGFHPALATRRIEACLLSKSNRTGAIPHDAALCRLRHKF